MPIIEPIPEAQATGAVLETFQALRASVGLAPNMYRTLGHAPKVLQAVIGMGKAIRSDLEPKLRELAYLKTAQVHDCQYWLHYHKALGQKAGLTPEQINDLPAFEESAAYSELEKDVLRFAEQWTNRTDVDPKVLERLSRSLSPSDLVILAATVGQANFTSRFNVVFDIPLP